jgi:molybdopterin-binding protein
MALVERPDCPGTTYLSDFPCLEKESVMKLSARNQLSGDVVAVKEGAVEAQVKIDIGGQTVTSVITMDALNEMGIAVGDKVVAIIKADAVMLGK